MCIDSKLTTFNARLITLININTLMNTIITSRILPTIHVYKRITQSTRAVAMGGGGYWMHTQRRLRAIQHCRFFNSEKVTTGVDRGHMHGSYPLTHGFDSDSNYRMGACQVLML